MIGPQQHAWYVYGIVPADVELTGDGKGIGQPPAPVGLVRSGDIGALVSEVDTSRPIGQPEDLLAHQRLLDATAGGVPVLPVRFGALLPDRRAVAEELLAPHHDEFLAALHELEARVQYVVRARYIEQAALAEVLAEDPDAAALRDQIRDAPDKASRDLRIRLGETVARHLDARRKADTETLVTTLAEHARGYAVRPPGHELDAANVAFLCETSQRKPFEGAVADLAELWRDRATVRLLGPQAAYDFVPTGAEA